MDIEELEKNWNTYDSLCRRLSDDNLNSLLDDLGERLVMCPASPKQDQYGCYPGGLIEHGLKVTNAMRRINTALDLKMPTASIIKVGLLHEIGKVGDSKNEYFLEQTSDWHREKLGQLYTFNENLDKMTDSHRTLCLLQQYGVQLTRDEWEAISTAQGFHLEENKFYAYTKNSLTKMLQSAKTLVSTQE